MIFNKRLNATALRGKPKVELVKMVEDLYQQIDNILEAIGYIETDIELIKNGDSHNVHDWP